MLSKTVPRTVRLSALIALAVFPVSNGFTKILPPPVTSPADAWRYADIADLFGAAPLVLRARITAATALKGTVSAPGATRFYVEGDVAVLIRGTQNVAPHVAWLVDIVPDSRGKMPKLRKADVLIAALPVQGRPGEIRLAARDAQVPWSPALESRVRAVVTSIAAPDSPPAVTGIASAFHSPGTVIGEGETQIFLSTVNSAPVSMTVLSRPGQPKRWAFAQGEIVDEAAEPPAPDSLAWYRLACFLPRSLPDSTTSELAQTDADSARSDYAFVMQALGACPRVRQR